MREYGAAGTSPVPAGHRPGRATAGNEGLGPSSFSRNTVRLSLSKGFPSLARECELRASTGSARTEGVGCRPQQFSYFQFRLFPSASHSSDWASRLLLVSSRLASVTHSTYSRCWLGGKLSKV